jgi:flagellar biosynthesis/type III secretory pathway chaperone
MKNNLLKEAIADAKAVRETALANAKIALEEAFTPRIQSMLSAKLSEEEGEEMAAEEPVAESEDGYEGETKTLDTLEEEGDYEEAPVEEGEEAPVEEPAPAPEPEAPVEEEEDLELEAIIKELEDEIEEDLDASDIGTGDNKVDQAEADPDMESSTDLTEDEHAAAEEAPVEEEEDVSIDEIIKALREEEAPAEEAPAEEPVAEEAEAAEELEEAYKVIKFMKSKLNEVNLLNAKLLFSNKLFRNHSLNESQKMKVIENFDRAQTLREVKLVFTTLSESFNYSRTKRTIKESYASKPSRSTRPKKVISEGTDLAARWKKLANL